MIDKFYIGIAELSIKIQSRFSFAREFCKDYIISAPDKADITVSADAETVKKEMTAADEPVSEEYAEILCIYRSIANQLPKFGCFVFHGAAISYNGLGYLFTAPSGTGKSTHIRLWRQYIGKDVDIINGDKPIIRISKDGVSVCSTPWAGKENWQKNRIFPLGGICLLNRGTQNSIEKLPPAENIKHLMNQIYLPKNPAMLSLTLEHMDKMLCRVPFYSLYCDMSKDAVKTSFEAMTGSILN